MTLKLLNTVLNTNAIWVDIIDNEVRYGTDDYRHSYFKMNLDTFSKLCKEWAYDEGFRLQTQKYKDMNYQCIVDEINIKFHSAKYGYTEPDATIQATQWILNTKDINDTI